MADVTVRYWAGARESAGVDHEPVSALCVADLVRQLTARSTLLGEVLNRSSLLVDGLVVRGDLALDDGQTVEVLPPFAGG